VSPQRRSDRAGMVLITKPFTMVALNNKVRELVE
jgi:hypothetical protein